jgi:hypothetical protein
MPVGSFGYRPSSELDDGAISIEAHDSAVVLSDLIERDQLARDLAAIERATAALRRGEPALESCTEDEPAATMQKPRPVWLTIGLLWLSTALVTAGAVAAIAKLVWS